MSLLPDRVAAQSLLEQHVQDPYQRLHARMVATAMAGYALRLGEDPHLWFLTGLLHDLDFDRFPDTHPAEAHAYGYHGYATLPRTRLAAALLACDEICGVFYAYRKMNPVRYGEMKAASIRKKLKDPGFAAKIDRATIQLGCDHLGVPLDDHVANLILFLGALDEPGGAPAVT